MGLLGQLVDRFVVGFGEGLLMPAELVFIAVDFSAQMSWKFGKFFAANCDSTRF